MKVLWLHFANQAAATKSDAEAIRLYYLIWEDWAPRRQATADQRADHLMWTRDFLSHAKVDGQLVVTFLATEIAPGTTRYHPSDPQHIAFVRRMREEARAFISAELSRRIGGSP